MRQVGSFAAQPSAPSIWISTLARKNASTSTIAIVGSNSARNLPKSCISSSLPEHDPQHLARGMRTRDCTRAFAHPRELFRVAQQFLHAKLHADAIDRFQRCALF